MLKSAYKSNVEHLGQCNKLFSNSMQINLIEQIMAHESETMGENNKQYLTNLVNEISVNLGEENFKSTSTTTTTTATTFEEGKSSSSSVYLRISLILVLTVFNSLIC